MLGKPRNGCTILEKEGGWKKSAWTAEATLCLPNLLSSQDEMDGSVGKGRVVDSVCLDRMSHNVLHTSADVTVWMVGVSQVRINGSEVQRAVLVGCALSGGC